MTIVKSKLNKFPLSWAIIIMSNRTHKLFINSFLGKQFCFLAPKRQYLNAFFGSGRLRSIILHSEGLIGYVFELVSVSLICLSWHFNSVYIKMLRVCVFSKKSKVIPLQITVSENLYPQDLTCTVKHYHMKAYSNLPKKLGSLAGLLTLWSWVVTTHLDFLVCVYIDLSVN